MSARQVKLNIESIPWVVFLNILQLGTWYLTVHTPIQILRVQECEKCLGSLADRSTDTLSHPLTGLSNYSF